MVKTQVLHIKELRSVMNALQRPRPARVKKPNGP